jgi:hypothetical protein
MVRVDVPVAPPMVNLLYARPCPENVLVAVPVSDRTIFAVFTNKLTLIAGALHTLPVPVSVHVPDPILIVVPAVAEPRRATPTVTLYVTASNVPLETRRVLVEYMLSASASCAVPEKLSKLSKPGKVIPLLVTVCVPRPRNKIVPDSLEVTTPVPKDQFP